MRKIISLSLIFVMMFALTAKAYLTREEIPPLTEEDHVAEALSELGILRGTESGLELEREVTRAEAIVLIWRVTGAVFPDLGYEEPCFEDVRGHWAYDAIEKFYRAGYIDGTSETTFEPDRSITGREFVKILLTVMGYDDAALGSCYDIGVKCRLLDDNYTKSVVLNDMVLTRSDAARICYGALIAELPDGRDLKDRLIENGVYTEETLLNQLISATYSKKSERFEDKLNEKMPEDKNYMFSPLSVKMALALAANGADGETREEILNTLGIDDLDEFNERAAEMILSYADDKVNTVNVSNSVWINKSVSQGDFSDSFKETAEKYYNAEAGTVTRENAVSTINSWVSEKTREKIPAIISEDNNNFAAMLLNAVYFKGMWTNDFPERNTKKGEFTSQNGEKSEIDFMNNTDYFSLYRDEDTTIIRLPYRARLITEDEETGEIDSVSANSQISMYLVMGEDENVSQLLKNTDMKMTYVNLSMPKFKIEYSVTLNGMLKSLGTEKAFDKNAADFSNMLSDDAVERFWIDQVIHKTYIDVDEKGTEAAAVTAIQMAGASLPPEPVEVKFDKPFTFVIKDDTRDEVLFMGRYAYAE